MFNTPLVATVSRELLSATVRVSPKEELPMPRKRAPTESMKGLVHWILLMVVVPPESVTVSPFGWSITTSSSEAGTVSPLQLRGSNHETPSPPPSQVMVAPKAVLAPAQRRAVASKAVEGSEALCRPPTDVDLANSVIQNPSRSYLIDLCYHDITIDV